MQGSAHNLKHKLAEIIFGTETPAGKRFDLLLIYAILLSVLALMLESVESIDVAYGKFLHGLEWFFTLFFTVEFALRLWVARNWRRYLFSFYGLVDLLSILPTYIAIFYPGASFMLIIRLLRVLRIFRILKLIRYSSEANVLLRSLLMARRKIFLFFSSVLVLASILGSLMYLVEGPENGFTSIPRSVYWTIVTITTVGYGDITPQSEWGQALAALVMLLGYSIIAVPTGIVTAELAQELQREKVNKICAGCGRKGHDRDASFCKFCGFSLNS